MEKQPSRATVNALCVFLVLGIGSGCQSRAWPLEDEKYTHFTPKADTPLRIEFDFPATWRLGKGAWIGGEYFISLSDKDPTPGEVDPMEEPPSFLIFARRVDPTSYSLDEVIDRFKSDPTRTVVGDRRLEVSGYPARWITYKLSPASDRLEPLIDEQFYILVGDFVYNLSFRIPEDERNGSFGQGFDHVIETLQVVK